LTGTAGTSALSGSSGTSGAGGFTWTEVTGTTQTMAVNSGYVANNAGLVSLTLPTTSALGSKIYRGGKGAGLWTVLLNAGESIHFGTLDTTTTTGTLVATQKYDSVTIVCTTTDTEWTVISSQGNITVT
jgi:hypothetical protein